ncbi:sirohydrochlorin chelatase [Lacicoccus qingdaonensis]|uniref:Sirohydrochlorin ferrochelatase n=1 Tax=Lacicoccus qingdaonensis TaxID=576118 RepID=A0A1G9AXN6_9BACL|nr:sirohydrochlorin chelatase [Salinicoccus qingdaonensis]SDK31993.1 sirohydrochlorin ferrochelatase [Salinicoccus qingdaonensis]
MRGVLYVSHGSRVRHATEEAVGFINQVITQVDIEHQEICFLELSEPDVEKGVSILVEKGVTELAVVPVLLLSAGHYFNDIPDKIEQVKSKYHDVTFIYGKPLGVQTRISNILKERIAQTGTVPARDAKLLVVGRGSYNPQTEIDISNIGEYMKETTDFQSVEVCYLAVCSPSFEEKLKTSLEERRSQIYIAPYLWFTGILERHIEKTVGESNSETEIVLCSHLGDHPDMQTALKDRVYETLKAGQPI